MYTRSEIVKILQNSTFPYHRVDLPFGLHTPGQDRSPTRDIIFPTVMDGKSVFELGCALGYFCFEAEKRGAKRVVGVEIDENRLSCANILKKINDSSVTLRNMDILRNEISEKFDYVLALNVLHHTLYPLAVLKKLSSITKEVMIIEFPTFMDPKFRKSARIFFPLLCNYMPVIGVSSLRDNKIDQTFVFSPKALCRILLDHERLFESVDFVKSPIKGRMIAFCRK